MYQNPISRKIQERVKPFASVKGQKIKGKNNPVYSA